MTELNDHLKLLFARAAALFCRRCGKAVRHDSAESICDELSARAAAAGDPRLLISFPVPVPANFTVAEVRELLARQGYTRFLEPAPAAAAVAPVAATARRGRKRRAAPPAPAVTLEVVQDRLRAGAAERGRILESLEAALRVGRGRVNVHVVDDADPPQRLDTWRYSSELHCAECDLAYATPNPSQFSFNSPLGACESCRGFGRTIGIDYGLVIPDETKTLRAGAIKPWQTKSYAECQEDLEKFAKLRGISLDTPWRELGSEARKWVIEGEGAWSKKVWYGVKRFFAWLETRAYKMHVRVLLSRYRAYTPCSVCDGARLKTEALLWRVGDKALADAALGAAPRFRPQGVEWSAAQLAALPGLSIHDLVLLPVERSHAFFQQLQLPRPLDEATDLLLGEIRGRFRYLADVGLGYLTLDRQSRTLSGGEVQRINLTTALGTSLVNTLFVLDEPSIGLHPRDMQRVIGVMKRLRDAGNSLVVVEHDPQIMLEADRILDLGPGAGERGGEIVFFGSPQAIRAHQPSLTGQYLSGSKSVTPARAPATSPRAPASAGGVVAEARSNRWLELKGACEHNLKNVDVRIPLKRLVCVTGVSGSGKSTLVEDVLYPALLKYRGKPTEAPGQFAGLAGAELIDDVVMVDQNPIGRTTRSNPASYVGAFDAIRALFAAEPAAQERKYTPGTFSFNSGNGRCPTCSGNGFEHVEMQFLSDVYLRCPDCDGRRYRDEVLDVRREGADGRRLNIAQVLELTVTEARAFFADTAEVAARLAPLADVGLEYLKLGQPVPTLSGGEAQRLKLAGHLAEAGSVLSSITHRGKLFLFDEPTTGLHFEDVAKLLRAFRKLLVAGHSLLVIEHNLDVIRAADWIIDLGPEGGERGGQIVCTGTPAAGACHGAFVHRPGARRLRAGADAGGAAAAAAAGRRAARSLRRRPRPPSPRGRHPQGARTQPQEHRRRDPARPLHGHHRGVRLGQVDARLRHTLQRGPAPLPRIPQRLRPAVRAAGRAPGRGRDLRHPAHGRHRAAHQPRRPQEHGGDAHRDLPLPAPAVREARHAVLPGLRRRHRAAEPRLDRRTAAARLQGQAHRPARAADRGAQGLLHRSGQVGGQEGLQAAAGRRRAAADARRGRACRASASTPSSCRWRRSTSASGPRRRCATGWRARSISARAWCTCSRPKSSRVTVFSTKRACPSCGRSFAELDPRLFSFNSKHGWCESCFGTGVEMPGFDEEQSGEEMWWNEWYAREPQPCSTCHGERLNPTALNVRFRERSIAALAGESVSASQEFFARLRLGPREREIARDLLAEIRARLKFLERVGLGYLQLDRAAPTLSGGEAQRIRLAAQLGSNLQGVCYVLDEPTIGLHPRDNEMLLDSLSELAGQRNTLVVVEHDEETIRRADYVLDLGPQAGVRGGEVVGAGTVQDLMRNPRSTTGRFLRAPLLHPAQPHRAVNAATPHLTLERVALHNMQRHATCASRSDGWS